MSSITVLERVELVPVLQVEALRFSTEDRARPTASRHEVPDAWDRYWWDSLADSDITDLNPVAPAAEYVHTTALVHSLMLEKVMRGIFESWGGIKTLSDPELNPFLTGGFVLHTRSKVLVEPACCSDLGTLPDWRDAADYRGAAWKMVWIGHPWISVRFQAPWLILSQPHESEDPVDFWAVSPDELSEAVVAAQTELERFSREIERILPLLGYPNDATLMARKLAGLCV